MNINAKELALVTLASATHTVEVEVDHPECKSATRLTTQLPKGMTKTAFIAAMEGRKKAPNRRAVKAVEQEGQWRKLLCKNAYCDSLRFEKFGRKANKGGYLQVYAFDAKGPCGIVQMVLSFDDDTSVTEPEAWCTLDTVFVSEDRRSEGVGGALVSAATTEMLRTLASALDATSPTQHCALDFVSQIHSVSGWLAAERVVDVIADKLTRCKRAPRRMTGQLGRHKMNVEYSLED